MLVNIPEKDLEPLLKGLAHITLESSLSKESLEALIKLQFLIRMEIEMETEWKHSVNTMLYGEENV